MKIQTKRGGMPMMIRIKRGGGGQSGEPGFSLVEIMVAALLLSFIVIGLLAMFNQTQRAFRSGMTQTDVLEAGRSTMDMLTRELEQMTPSHELYTTNFHVWVSPLFQNLLTQSLPGSQVQRSNAVQNFIFLSRENTLFVGTGYRVFPEYPDAGVGSLYRWTVANPAREGARLFPNWFQFAPLSDYNRIVDGVVHLRLRAYDAKGNLINPGMAVFPKEMDFYTNRIAPDQAEVVATNNAVPAFVELELGLLEQQVFHRWKSLANDVARRNYLSNQAARVHVFRNRVPIRNVDLSVYP